MTKKIISGMEMRDRILAPKEKEFDLLVFIGRFQPLHLQHKRIIDIALQKSRHVLVLVGSAGKARTIRNPFTFEERRDMILGSYDETIQKKHIIIKPLYDKTYNDAAWIKQVQDIVKGTALDIVNKGGFRVSGLADVRIGLVGASKDAHTEYYLRMFPQWKSVDAGIETDLNATTIRETYLSDGTVEIGAVPVNVANFLIDFRFNGPHLQLHDELQFVRNYKKQWEVSPYPVKHATVDAVVEQSGHILLVKRRSAPGKGLWALPGGHLNEYETQLDGAIRELKEETGIKVPEAVLRGSIVADYTFDDPYRSTLGRVITRAFHIKLKDDVTLPKVRGADDAIRAKWIPISELREDMLFDDHFFVIAKFLSL